MLTTLTYSSSAFPFFFAFFFAPFASRATPAFFRLVFTVASAAFAGFAAAGLDPGAGVTEADTVVVVVDVIVVDDVVVVGFFLGAGVVVVVVDVVVEVVVALTLSI